MIQVFVIATTPLGQAGLRSLLTAPEFQVAGTSALPTIQGVEPVDVIVVADDILLPEIGRALPDPRTLALVVLSNNSERYLEQLQRIGLRGWGLLPLDAPADQLQAAVSAVARGLICLPIAQAEQLTLPLPMTETSVLTEPEETLTAREREVLELVSQGLANKLIARQLQISEHTVKFHISSISNKLGATSRTDAVRLGLRRGLITI